MSLNETEAPILVIGYGNELRGDDGAGPAAAVLLRRRLAPEMARVLTVHQLLPELAEELSRSTFAVFIDADCSIPPGQFGRCDLAPAVDRDKTLGHQQSPEGLLMMARQLYGHTPPAILFYIGAADFEFRQGLSRQVRRAMPKLVQAVVDAVEEVAGTSDVVHHA